LKKDKQDGESMVEPTIPLNIQIIQKAIGVAAGIAQMIFTGDNDNIDKQKEILDKYTERQKNIVKKQKRPENKTSPKIDLTSELYEFKKKMDATKPNMVVNIDMSSEKIKGGTSCIICERDHITQATSLLEEAYRFIKRPEHGINSDEVKRRVHKALKELNAGEREDLAAENIEKLEGEEKSLAEMALNISSQIRHDITDAVNKQNPEEFSKAVAKASELSDKYFNKVWDYTVSSGKAKKSIGSICGEDPECRKRLEATLDEK